MSHHVTRSEAQAVLPVLRNHAARLLAGTGERRAVALADQLRAGTAGGNAVEGLNQNTDEGFPEELQSFWRVLVAFEHLALGGEVVGGGAIASHRGDLEQPRPWMLHAAAHAITRQDGALEQVAEEYRAVPRPNYRPLAA